MTCGPSRWDSPGEKTRHLLHGVSHKFTATCVCLAWQGPQTRLPGPPPHPTAIRQNKPGAVGACLLPLAGTGVALVLVCLSDVRQPGHQEADVEGWVWVRLSEHPCSPVLLGISGPSADDLPLCLSSFLPCSCPPPSPAPPSLRHCPHPSPWPLHSLRGHRWAVCSPVWACLSRSPKTAYSVEAGSSLAHSGLRPLGYSRGLKASIHSFLYLVPEAPPEHLPLRRPGWAVTQSSLQESGRNRDSGHWEMRGGPGSSPCAVQSVTRREGLKSRKQFYGHACNLCIQVPSPAIPEAG